MPNQRSQPRDSPVEQAFSDENYTKIPDEDRNLIDEVFAQMDIKKKGWLDSYEFKHSLIALDLGMSDYCRELENYGTVPPDWRGPHNCPVTRLLIYPDQFRLCASKLIAQQEPREEAMKVFNLFDYDQDGIISVEDIKQLAQEIKEEHTIIDEEIKLMIQTLDQNGKGGVNVEEFTQMLEEASQCDII